MTRNRASITQTFELRGEECTLRIGIFDDGTAVGLKVETDNGKEIAVGLTGLDALHVADALVAAAGNVLVIPTASPN